MTFVQHNILTVLVPLYNQPIIGHRTFRSLRLADFTFHLAAAMDKLWVKRRMRGKKDRHRG